MTNQPLDAASVEKYSVPMSGAGNRRALDGYAWECAACGKRSRDLFGFERLSYGWDESCVLNAHLVKVES